MSAKRPVVIIAFGASSRATAAAGPVISINALTECLADRYDFRILAKPGIGLGDTVESPHGRAALMRYFRQTPHDLVMLSSFFDREFTMPILQLRRLGLIPRVPAILSPRGEFSPGALALKSRRKTAYFELARRFGLLRDVWMHATGPNEAEDIERVFPHARGIVVSPNVRVLQPLPSRDGDRAEALRVVFLSRIDRKKNLDYGIKVLARVSSPVQFDIFGPVTHGDYWEECQRAISRLPSHIAVRYLGEIPSRTVMARLASYDLFFLPTAGENFGHAIFDALECGVPILISDQTPWRNLEASESGWDLPLDAPESFVAAITHMAAAPSGERDRLRRGARRLAEATVIADDASRVTDEMLRGVLAHG